jgi:hypothetical protein
MYIYTYIYTSINVSIENRTNMCLFLSLYRGCSLETSCRNVDSSTADDSDIRFDDIIGDNNDGIVNRNDDDIDSTLVSAIPASSPLLSSDEYLKSINGINTSINEVENSNSEDNTYNTVNNSVISSSTNADSSSLSDYRREPDTSSSATSGIKVERYSIIDIAEEGNNATADYISKENKRAIEDTLNVKLLNCKINSNQVYIYMSVYVYIYIYIYMCVYRYVYVYIYIYEYIYIYIYIYIFSFFHINICIFIHIYI